MDRVSFVLGDASATPFGGGTFALILAINVIDCVSSPMALLAEVSRLLETGGIAVIATPWDWSPNATSAEHWLGGHSPRRPDAGDPASVFRSAVGATDGLELAGERDGIPWSLRLHERSTMQYTVYMAAVRKTPT